MLKLLVVEDNVMQSKQIINFISENNDDIKLYNMAYTYKEAIDIVKAQLVDIILLDLKLPDGLGTDIVGYLHNNNLTKYLQSVIVVSGENELFLTIHDSPYVFSYIPKPYSLDVIYDDMVSLVRTKKDNVVLNKINQELAFLHYNFSYNGTRYLAEVIFELYNLYDSYKDVLLKDVYSIVAKKHDKSVNTIHGNIKQSTRCMYLDCEEDVINQYFNYSYFVKPRLKEIIFTVINKIGWVFGLG